MRVAEMQSKVPFASTRNASRAATARGVALTGLSIALYVGQARPPSEMCVTLPKRQPSRQRRAE